MQLFINGPVFNASSFDGNPNPTNLAPFPFVATSGPSFVQVETFKDCDGNQCIPDLALTHINTTLE